MNRKIERLGDLVRRKFPLVGVPRLEHRARLGQIRRFFSRPSAGASQQGDAIRMPGAGELAPFRKKRRSQQQKQAQR